MLICSHTALLAEALKQLALFSMSVTLRQLLIREIPLLPKGWVAECIQLCSRVKEEGSYSIKW